MPNASRDSLGDRLGDDAYHQLAAPVSVRRVGWPCWVMAVIAAGGGTALWAHGLMCLAVGWALWRRPPRCTLGPWLDYAAMGLLAWGAVGLLPLGYLGQWLRPEWWQTAHTQLGIALPPTLWAQPWVAWQGYLGLWAGVGFVYLCLDQPMHHHKRLQWLWTLVGLGAVLSLVLVLCNARGLRFPLAPEATVFTYFPNRNQTALVLAALGVVAFGLFVDGLVQQRQKATVLGLLCTVCLFLGLVSLTSRAGVVLFFAGLGCLGLLAVQHARAWVLGSWGPYALFGVFVLGCLAVLAAADNPARWWQMLNWELTPQHSFRTLLAWDALRMLAEQPLVGVGWGHFADVFAQYRQASVIYGQALHPESDWLWLACQGGLVALLCVGVAAAGVLRRVLALPALPHVRYRLIAAGGLLVCMAHTWVDVSMHRWGTFGLMSLLLAAALKGRSDALPHPEGRAVPVVREDTRLPQGLIRAAGGVLVAFGVLAVLGGLWGLPATPEPLRARLQQRVQLALAAGQPEALQAAVGAGLSLYPLDAWFHFQQGQGALRLQGDLDGAVRAFERVNFLQPQHIYWALQQGLLYLPVSPGLAFAAWQRALGLPNFAPEATWRWLLNHTLDTPRYVPHLQRLAQVHSTFGVYYLKALPAGPLLHQALVQYLEYCPGLEAFTEQDKHTLLGRWSQSGGALACLDYLREHPGHVPQPWRYRALAYGALGFVQMACELVLEEVEPPHLLAHTRLRTPVALEEARRRFLLAPQDMLLAASLVEGYASEKSFDKCLSVIADFEPHAPWRHLPWGFYFYKGWALYTKGQYEAAWEALAQYVLHL